MSENKNVFEKIFENYNYINKMMVEEMEIASKHDGLTGDHREQMWLKLFRSIIPQKFSMSQGVMIIDSDGNVSKEVDIAVYDEQYTPYVFQYNTLKFIPIEAVAVVIECKSTSVNKDKLVKWADAIEKLKPSPCGIARIVSGYACGLTNTSQTRTRPIKILAATKEYKTTESQSLNELEEKFDFIIHKNSGVLNVRIKNGDKCLGWWGVRLNKADKAAEDKDLEIERLTINDNKKTEDIIIPQEYKEFFDENKYFIGKLKDLEIIDNPLLSLNLQLNQLLMLINNPMLFPHYAYAKTFNKIIEEVNKENKKGM